MITDKTIISLVEEQLAGSDHFLVDVLIKPGNKIFIFIDGDNRVSIDVCIKLSRFVESHFDRDVEDFELMVSSTGVDRPLKLPRQYKKNIGFMLDIVLNDGEKFTGTVVSADDTEIVLEKQPEKKSKKEVEKILLTIKYTDIKTAKEVITFKK